MKLSLLYRFTLFCFISLLISFQSAQAIPAFPSAEGYGADTVGGRGGIVIHVTSLDDNGPGTLREAIESDLGTNTPRTIVFRTGGLIELYSAIEFKHPFVTLAGQTAPGDGIAIKTHKSFNGPALEVKTHDVIIRYLRVRPGMAELGPGCCGDGIVMADDVDFDVYNIVIDHVSISWSTDENISVFRAKDVSIQWSIFSEALVMNLEAGATGRGALIGDKFGDSGRISFHHNLMAHNKQRNPNFATADTNSQDTIHLYNNVIYNWGDHGSVLTSQTNSGLHANIIGNYFKRGANTNYTRYPIALGTLGLDEQATTQHSEQSIYVEANIDNDPASLPNEKTVSTPNNLSANAWDIMGDGTTATNYLRVNANNIYQRLTPWPEATVPVSLSSPFDAYEQVLSSVGASTPLRDSVDNRIISDVESVAGKWIRFLEDIYPDNFVCAWPLLDIGLPKTDTDSDGMPDDWELQQGLNPNNTADSNDDMNSNGYTNLEDYLNALVVSTNNLFADARQNFPNVEPIQQSGLESRSICKEYAIPIPKWVTYGFFVASILLLLTIKNTKKH